MKVTFFGNKDTPDSVLPTIQAVLKAFIENENATVFYVGHNGNFDKLVQQALYTLKQQYPQIVYFVVLTHHPKNSKNEVLYFNYENTILPEEIAVCPPRFAISKRNNWMIKQSDVVVTYVKHPFGGAAKFKELALSKKKRVVELSEVRST